ncbi:hypothetical protein D7M15_05910 [Streptomyces sp. Z26]|nr:hypothetical protein D7M15_05910 [Streptomyces sp. Z26]
MTGYGDFSPYVYLLESIPDAVCAVNVGWLEPGWVFPRGDAETTFVDALGVLCRDESRARSRGWHACRLGRGCEQLGHPLLAQVNGTEVALGAAEVRVVSEDGRWLIAPDLVHHYVTAHRYQPPSVFMEAVLARRVVPPQGPSPPSSRRLGA